MSKADLYRDGARVPEQLSRLIFLEAMVNDRRVLEVGGTPQVAKLLLALGAARVVCAVDVDDGGARLESLRAANNDERVDYRGIRRPPPSSTAPMLPGDDGAFDLVLDFTLPEAIAAGEGSERLKELKRLMSDDGFALTALSSQTQGLGALLNDGDGPTQASYRAMVEALRDSFELVQVYFQSLLLGYLFGSFDVDPSGDGVAPQTALMGDAPEPAAAYLFAFGNAIPVIEDVCLVQMPFDGLLDAIAERRAVTAPAVAIEPAVVEVSIASAVVVGSRPTRAENFDDETELGLLGDTLPEAAERIASLETLLLKMDHELARALEAHAEMRSERDLLAEQLVQNDGSRITMQRQLVSIENELAITTARINELEDLCVSLDSQRANALAELLDEKTRAEGERQRRNAEREMLEAAVKESERVIDDLSGALEAAGLSVRDTLVDNDFDKGHFEKRHEETSTVAARLRATLEERFANEKRRYQQRTDEAVRLAKAVNDLTTERAHWLRLTQHLAAARDVARAQAVSAQTQVDGLIAQVSALQHRDAGATQTPTPAPEQSEERRRADRRQLEEAQRQLANAADQREELVAQRMVLQQALTARERELEASMSDMLALRAQVEQLTARNAVLERGHSNGSGDDSDHQKTRDELADLTNVLLQLEEEVHVERTRIAQRTANAHAALEHKSAVIHELQEQAARERARGDLLRAQLEEAQRERDAMRRR